MACSFFAFVNLVSGDSSTFGSSKSKSIKRCESTQYQR